MNIPASLRPWCWTLGWLLLIVTCVGLIHLQQSLWRGEIVRSFAEQRYFSESVAAPSVMLFGDSLIGRSFPEDRISSDLFGVDVDWAKLWIAGASYNVFIPFLERTRPHLKLAVINLETLVKARSSDDPVSTFKLFLKIVKWRLQFGPSFSNELMNDRNGRAYLNCSPLNEEGIKKKISALSLDYKNNRLLTSDALRFLQLLKTSAERVVVVRLPRSEVLEMMLGDSLSLFQESLSQQLSKESVELLQLGLPMPDDHYCDGSHPNSRGVAVRARMLVDLVGKILPSTL